MGAVGRPDCAAGGTVSLLPARRGYAYQHLYSAAVIAGCLRNGFAGANVDRKHFPGDVFDDLEVHSNQIVSRVQIKSHMTGSRAFCRTDFSEGGVFPLASAFRTFTVDPAPAADYRLICTWGLPANPESLMCSAEDSLPLLPGSRTRRFRLNESEIWADAEPAEGFGPLADAGTREQFYDFCKRFLIELQAPIASLEIDEPGPLERLMFGLLAKRLGVGLWPNETRMPEDVAASAIWAVTRAGARPDLHISPSEFAQSLSLVVDHGRVPEAFPIDDRWQVGREEQVAGLLSKAAEARRLVVTGPPGSGKSWLLRGLADAADQNGWATAIHFCYIDSFDVSLRRRTTVEATMGSLIAGLADSCEYEHPADAPLYSSRPEDLVAHVQAAAQACPAGRVLLVVDGLDHASRIDPTAIGMTTQSHVIAEALADLELPSCACLVVGSQPGAFLDTLEGGATWSVAPWSGPDIEDFLTTVGWPAADSMRETAALFESKSAGNPLYLTYLVRELRAFADEALQPEDVARALDGLPVYGEDLGDYYRHLLNGVETTTGSIIIPELLALLDFPLSADELKAVLPTSAHHVDSTLSGLRPVLTEAATQGGIRIYHESFQRFIRSDLRARGADLRHILEPANDWLRSLGFFEDSRAFRSSLRTLILSNRIDEAFALCGHDFVAKAVSHGFGFGAITQALRDVATAAGRQRRWDVLARVNELMNAANMCFDGKLADDEAIEFARALAEVRDPVSIADRLTWEGRPEWGYRTGLLLCGFCDEAGAVAPWEVYLGAHSERDDENTAYGEASDELLEASILRGRIRLSEPDYMLQRIVEVLGETEDVRPRVLTVGKVVAETLGLEALDSLIDAASGRNRARLLLAKAEHLKRRATDESRAAAQSALDQGLSGEELGLALALGASKNQNVSADVILEATRRVVSEKSHLEPEIAAEWLVAVSSAHDEDLDSVVSELAGVGWYRCWLRFCVALERRRRGSGSAIAAIRLLQEDVQPFVGNPRTCDLYSLQGLIHGTIAQGLSLTSEDEWEEALEILAVVSRETTTYLQRSPGGPLTLVPLLHLVLAEADSERKVADSARFVRAIVAEGDAETTYYGLHAHFELVRAQAEALLGDPSEARLSLDRAALYLTAYGFRKDVTIFGLLDSLEGIHDPRDPGWTRARLVDLQAPVEALLTHTDGKETRHAFPRWNAMIAELDPIGSLRYFALRLRRAFATMDYVVERALPKAIASSEGASGLTRIAAAVCLVSDGVDLVPTAHCSDDPICQALQASKETALLSDDVTESRRASGTSVRKREAAGTPASDCSVGELCEALHGLRWLDSDEAVLADFARIAASRVLTSATPRMTLSRIAVASESLSRNPVLERLADELSSVGEAELAAECLVLAFTGSGDGWRNYGDAQRVDLIEKAVELSENRALDTLAAETVDFTFARPGWNGITEQLPCLTMRISGLDAARRVWLEAFAVVEHRLPATGLSDRLDVRYVPAEVDSGNELDIALAELVFSRLQHVGLDRRSRATLAAAALLASGGQPVYTGLSNVVVADMSVTAVSVLLSLLAEFGQDEQVPHALLESLELAEASDLLCLRVPARKALRLTGLQVLSPPPTPPDTGSHTARGLRPRKAWESANEVWADFSNLMLSTVQDMHKVPWVDRWMTAFIDNVTSPHNRSDWGRTWSPLDEAEQVLSGRLAASVRSALAKQGELRPDAEDRIAEALLPDWSLRVRYEASRSPRPGCLPLPGDAESPNTGVITDREVLVVPDGSLEGWSRIAVLEHERRKGDSYFDPISEASAYFGLCFGDDEVEGLPFGIGDHRTWLEQQSAQRWPWGFCGPLVGVAVVRDWAGVFEVPALHPKIVSRLQLQSAEWRDGLTLIDRSGKPAAIVHHWRGPFPLGEDLAKEVPSFEGVELLLRPDMLEKVQELAGDAGRCWRAVTGLKEVESEQ